MGNLSSASMSSVMQLPHKCNLYNNMLKYNSKSGEYVSLEGMRKLCESQLLPVEVKIVKLTKSVINGKGFPP